MPHVTPIARDAVGVRADDVERAVADHHRARPAPSCVAARARASRSCPRRARSSCGPATTSKCSRRPIARSSGSAKWCGLEVATASRCVAAARRAPRRCPVGDRRLGQRGASRSARGRRRCSASTSGSSGVDAEQLAEAVRERRADVGQQLRARAPRGGRACRTRSARSSGTTRARVHQHAVEVEDHRGPHRPGSSQVAHSGLSAARPEPVRMPSAQNSSPLAPPHPPIRDGASSRPCSPRSSLAWGVVVCDGSMGTTTDDGSDVDDDVDERHDVQRHPSADDDVQRHLSDDTSRRLRLGRHVAGRLARR